MAETITQCGITVPKSRFYSFVIFGNVELWGKIHRIGESVIYVDNWQSDSGQKWKRVAPAMDRMLDQMLPHGEDEISIQCGYREWGESEKGKAWTVKQWRDMIAGNGQGELFDK